MPTLETYNPQGPPLTLVMLDRLCRTVRRALRHDGHGLRPDLMKSDGYVLVSDLLNLWSLRELGVGFNDLYEMMGLWTSRGAARLDVSQDSIMLTSTVRAVRTTSAMRSVTVHSGIRSRSG
eukprot:5715230-Heterocapsa_arctica.AAC.1